jgi:hypothetical protein
MLTSLIDISSSFIFFRCYRIRIPGQYKKIIKLKVGDKEDFFMLFNTAKAMPY